MIPDLSGYREILWLFLSGPVLPDRLWRLPASCSTPVFSLELHSVSPGEMKFRPVLCEILRSRDRYSQNWLWVKKNNNNKKYSVLFFYSTEELFRSFIHMRKWFWLSADCFKRTDHWIFQGADSAQQCTKFLSFKELHQLKFSMRISFVTNRHWP